MKKFYFLAAIAAMTLASCSSNESLWDENDMTPAQQDQISFVKKTVATSRTSGLETEVGTFRVYGVKGSGTQVFNNYAVWHMNASGTTTTNPQYWEYVGANGTEITPYVGEEGGTLTAASTITLDRDQDIKYWDYSADTHLFWAVAPWDDKVKFYDSSDNELGSGDTGNVAYTLIENVGGHLKPNTGAAVTYSSYYLANPVEVARADYKTPVTFTFARSQAKVRVGVYETIPGYSVTDIKFWEVRVDQNGNPVKVKSTASDNIILNRTAHAFQGNDTPGTAGTMKVEYDNTNLTYAVSYDDTEIVAERAFYAGALTGVPATSSTASTLWGTDGDMQTGGYFSVMPTPSDVTARPIYIVCDFELTPTDGTPAGVINVKGARCVIPAEYANWKPNTAYTYILKLTDNTNGVTNVDPDQDPTLPSGTDPSDPGVDPEDPANPDPEDPTDPSTTVPDAETPDTDNPEGLYAITFDAVVEDYVDATVGTTTTFATPSITTYQDGMDVTAAGIVYAAGEDITITVMEGSTDATASYEIYCKKIAGSYNYAKTADQNVGGSWGSVLSSPVIAAPEAGTYVLRATKSGATSYKVVVVGSAESN